VAVVVEGNGVGNGEWPDAWKKRIVESTSDHFKVVSSLNTEHELRKVHYMTGKGRPASDSKKDSAAPKVSDSRVQFI
jgi:hypothetical protein